MKGMKLYLLSIVEAEKMAQEQRECGHWWWLRSPGGFMFNASAVSIYGYILDGGINVYDSSGGVRPALQIKSSICAELPKTEEGAVLFGQNPETGEAAEWLVIEQDKNITTLLAKECLGYHCFNGSKENGSNFAESEITTYMNNFADSEIFAYMNVNLLNACFSEEEQDRILSREMPETKTALFDIVRLNKDTCRIAPVNRADKELLDIAGGGGVICDLETLLDVIEQMIEECHKKGYQYRII